MKKSLIVLSVAAALCANAVFAGTALSANKKTRSFTMQHWYSRSMEDVITIQNSVEDYVTRVFITVGEGYINQAYATGMNIKGCGSITHVNSGSSVICELSTVNPVISLSADKSSKEFVAYGTYEVA